MKGLRVRKPKLRLTSKGIKLSGGHVRVGGKIIGANVSKSGLNVSGNAGLVTYNTRRGVLHRRPGCPLFALMLVLSIAAIIVCEVEKAAKE